MVSPMIVKPLGTPSPSQGEGWDGGSEVELASALTRTHYPYPTRAALTLPLTGPPCKGEGTVRLWLLEQSKH